MAEASGTWILEGGTIDGHTLRIPNNVEGNLTIQPGRFGGHSGCNGFGGDVSESDHTIAVGSMVQTLIGCSNEINQFERSYVGALARVTELHRTGTTLTLVGSGVALHFTPAPT